MNRLITRDPAGGGELIVTRLEAPATGIVIEGRFSLGWIGSLTPEQLDFVGVLLRRRNNLQQVSTDLGVAYNTVRARLDAIVEALDGSPALPAARKDRSELLNKLAEGEIDVDEALSRLT